ncbi:Hypothetical protein F387_00073 [Wohlfahrtiimonas chitiniclastica SH04]|uniref:ATPase AAA-type core domain-containing protein n=1 Tax=Wohlfahrtiimonas chitiniclastica SH04 TaxID=1261130 RepID=L8Y2J4_9GAMM|nr:AAA family ATPase [Wohlfahrtiimonas chitiniclastica]ELV08681.1 Hypothetical protein F387_00073 [Wohlfahrtiimonas chitiniclastica SH04]
MKNFAQSLQKIKEIYELASDEVQEQYKELFNFFIAEHESLSACFSSRAYSSFLEESLSKLAYELSKISIQEVDDKSKIFITKDNGQVQEINSKSEKTFFDNIFIFIKRLFILNFFKEENKNVILLGANGSGKSSLANFLKDAGQDQLVVIPAQKYLFLYDNIVYYKPGSDISTIRNIQNQQDFKAIHSLEEYGINFRNLMTSVINEYTENASAAYQNKPNIIEYEGSIVGKICKLFHDLIPSIELNIDTRERIFYPSHISTRTRYDFNSMSDGERAIIFYLSNVLIAKSNSIIVIDEPETYINPAIYKKLWDMLILERPDCQFIFITHSMDFIASRDTANTNYYWIKEFIAPDNWSIQQLPTISDMPQTLIAELASSRKPILFCEGLLESYDYQIYNALFSDSYTIQPVESHITVINYTKAFNNSKSEHNNRAIGIIDGDLLIDDDRIAKYAEQKIYVLPFNEIEMLLLWEPIIQDVLAQVESDQSKIIDKITEFKSQFFKKVEIEKNQISIAFLKKQIDIALASYRIQTNSSIEEIRREFSNLSKNMLDIDEINLTFTNRLDSIIEHKDYEALLFISSLKGQILKGLGNRYLDSNYDKRALCRIIKNPNLQTKIKEEFFKKI